MVRIFEIVVLEGLDPLTVSILALLVFFLLPVIPWHQRRAAVLGLSVAFLMVW